MLAPPSPRQKIGVTHLKLTNFRNYKYLSLHVEEMSVILTGPNGIGKTNLLEAISLLTPGRGLRSATNSEIINQGHRDLPWGVHSTLITSQDIYNVGTGLERTPQEWRRVFHLNQTPLSQQSDMQEFMQILWLTPLMDQLFSEAATQRRKFYDRLVAGHDNEHLKRVQAYEQIMRERLRLLKEGRFDSLWLNALEHQMAEQASAITAARVDYADHLNTFLKWEDVPELPTLSLQLVGCNEENALTTPALEQEDYMRNQWAMTRQQDRESGRTTFGPHRSDMLVTYHPKNMPAALCSTGEQKIMLLALIMAAARSYVYYYDRCLILLLDEVVAHLDMQRRGVLASLIRTLPIQTWMTGTEKELFTAFQNGTQFINVATLRSDT